MPQLILWNGLHLQIQIPEHGTTRAGKHNEEAKIKKSRSGSLCMNHLLSIVLLLFLPDVLLLEISDNSIQDLLLTTLKSTHQGGKSDHRERRRASITYLHVSSLVPNLC